MADEPTEELVVLTNPRVTIQVPLRDFTREEGIELVRQACSRVAAALKITHDAKEDAAHRRGMRRIAEISIPTFPPPIFVAL
jgi:hypothetical protein